MGAVEDKWSDFSVNEWFRLDGLSTTYESNLKQAYLKTVVQGQQVNSLLIRNVFTDIVVDTAVSTAQSYEMVFNPNAPVYRGLVDYLTDGYMKRVLNDESAKRQVASILPTGLSLSQRRNRLDTFGLDGRSAVRIERMRQAGEAPQAIQNARLSFAIQRGNLLALTEVNRAVNLANETVWIENLKVMKAVTDVTDYWWIDVGSGLTSLANLPKRARKTIITRRDGRVCDYCLPLEEVKTRIGDYFDTEYGYFVSPPFHPLCRCYAMVTL